MDSFVSKFFPGFRAPGAPFTVGDGCTVNTFFSGILTVNANNSSQNRSYYANQPMTAAGIAECSIIGGPVSLDGLNRAMLTPEGNMNIDVLSATLKNTSGMQTSFWSAHVAELCTWDWGDNHTTLIFNMLRFVFMRKWTETSGNLNIVLPEYNDGHVEIDRNQWWPATYPAANEWEWPGGRDAANYPEYNRLTGSAPESGEPCLDLRGQTSVGARFVLLMLSAWRRRSRFRLDMAMPRLAEKVEYRSHTVVDNLDAWMAEGGVPPLGAQVPPLPTAEEAWGYLRAYVTQNRVYDHFSTALYMLCTVAYQFLPVTAESNYWLSLNWVVVLPEFKSVRGRYVFLNEGIAALVSHRALAEWGYINSKLEKINLMALVVAQAAQTGMGIRAVRYGMEDEPQDLLDTHTNFYMPVDFFSAAMAEAVRCRVPLSGMEGVYTYTYENFDMYDEGRRVRTRIRAGDAALQSYTWVPYDRHGLITVLQRIVGTEAEYREARATEAVPANQVVLPRPVSWAMVDKRPVAQYWIRDIEVPNQAGEERLAELIVPWMTLAGYPVFLVPITPCPFPTPLGLAGRIDKTQFGEQGRRALKLKWYQLWYLANLNRLSGYDTVIAEDDNLVGGKQLYAPNHVNMVWPLLKRPDTQWIEASVTDMVARERMFIKMPQLTTKFFMGELDYKVQVISRGVGTARRIASTYIRDYGGVSGMARLATVSYNVDEGVERLRGYITREEQDFSVCSVCSSWRDASRSAANQCTHCRRVLGPWWRQALMDYGAEQIGLLNARECRAKSDRNPFEFFDARKAPLTKDNIPVWCNIRGTNLSAASRHKCTYVLVHVTYSKLATVFCWQSVRIGNDSVNCYVVPCEDVYLYYVAASEDAMLLPPLVRRAMSAAASLVDGYDYSEGSGCRYLLREFEVDRYKIGRCGNTKAPEVGEFPRSVVTGEHHTHFRPEEIWAIAMEVKTTKRAVGLILEGLRKIEGMSEAIVGTFMMFALTCRPQIAYIIACSRKIWACKDVGALVATLKSLSTPLKSMHNRDLLDMTQLFELQTLVNRGVGSVDWKQEKSDRVRPNVVEVDPIDVYREARNIFAEGRKRGFKYKTMDAKKYVKSRWEWVPTGSVHSQYEDDEAYIKKNYRHRTKFVTLNMMSEAYIRRMFTRRPEIQAWASVKYEWAKQRAIYGVDLTSSVITNLAMYRCEEVFKHRFPVGEEAAAERVHRRLAGMLKDHESYCYDFDNFNAQHSVGSMYAVLTAYRDTFKNRMSEDQLKAMEWVCESLLHVKVHNNMSEHPDTYEPKGTLLSGWRLTTFMNTALNFIYFKIGGALDSRGVVDSVHNGDDVLLSINNLKAAVTVHKRMSDINARAQASKCNVFSVGEFLRVEHKITKETGLGAQYLTRACATVVHSRTESQAPIRFTEAVKSMYTRVEELASRCKDKQEVLTAIMGQALNRVADVFRTSVEVCRLMVQSHVLVGGCIAGQQGRIDKMVSEEIVYLEPSDLGVSDPADEATVDDLMPGIRDYADALALQYEGIINLDWSIKRVSNATRRQLAITRSTRLAVTDVSNETRYKYGRALYGLYRGIIDVPHVEKARFAGISPIALLDREGTKQVQHLIKSVADVEYTLRVLL
nr:RNA dependent RNA polymerase RdRp [Pterostylis totivirus]